MTATAKKISYEFTTDDDELCDEKTTDQATMCNFYKLNLPASASILSKQIAKSQAKRAKKEERHRRRVDLSTVREQDEKASEENGSPLPSKEDLFPSAPPSQLGRSRIDAATLDVKLKRQASLPEEERKAEPMDEEEAQLLAMLLSGIEQNGNERKFSLTGNNLPAASPLPLGMALPSPGLPRMPPSAKVSEWLLERSTSPDNVSVVSSVLLEDNGVIMNEPIEDDDEVFFDAEDGPDDVVVSGVEHEMQGLSLNRNMAAMTQSLVRVEEETTTTDGGMNEMMNGRTGRSSSVSPRPTNEQFVRNSNGSATFNVKHSSTLARHQKFTPPTVTNGNMTVSQQITPLSSRTTRSVLRVHNVNSISNSNSRPLQMSKMSVGNVLANNPTNNRRAISGIRQPDMPLTSTPHLPQKTSPPTVTINPSTPSRPASVASSAGRSSVLAGAKMSNLEGLQDLIQMQEEALRRAALDGQASERKLSWHSDQDANRQSTSTHSSLGSLCSSKSIDGAHALSKLGTPTSRIPTPRSRLPTPRGSTLPKRVSIGVQTDIPWPPPCVLRHRSQSLPSVRQTEPMVLLTSSTNASDPRKLLGKPPRAPSRRMARSLLVPQSVSYDSPTLASFLLVPPRK